MPDQINEPTVGPDAMFSTELPPSRGQYHAIAVLALELLEVDPPKHRLDASIAIVRLRSALLGEHAPPPRLPDVAEPF